ncbi:MAG: hypothetical protein F6K40_24605 [Okeania sp. SIO3I5]|uniref:hypothetical protein n=1 Tax=Okeania sp. SIO3I5 TaxID=2607805 RepID=UPI0013B8DA64|nr:hypothetical protein [Okeania sp. SIO3I5]NEQ39259.1 hypothetical protein [Okeania sp. SIO3I5]
MIDLKSDRSPLPFLQKNAIIIKINPYLQGINFCLFPVKQRSLLWLFVAQIELEFLPD